ncbi:MAG: hypothetical protein JWO60_1991, partial [Frankiales bacterium]|nr:hypothetical protein [Frankiales bacterium]
MPPAPQPIGVVLPLLGDALPLLAAVAALVEGWPAQVDARLVLAAPVLGPRDRGLLAELGEDVQLVEVPGDPTFGGLAVAAAEQADDTLLLVLDPAALPAPEALAALVHGGTVDGAALFGFDGSGSDVFAT